VPRLLTNPTKTIRYYAIDQCVGRDAPNDRQDVLLVQFFLSVATSSLVTLPGTPIGTQVPGSPIVVDGYCGQQTIGFIEYVQQRFQQAPVPRSYTMGQVWPHGTAGDNTLGMFNDMMRHFNLNWYLPAINGFPGELKPLLFFEN